MNIRIGLCICCSEYFVVDTGLSCELIILGIEQSYHKNSEHFESNKTDEARSGSKKCILSTVLDKKISVIRIF